ncbi:hypothetical protein SS50377_26212 [Spironucleus salmonicida]|uniref:Uncharacterized protein n=1 Tax=Spironucleus salmonicida TaxID=348837 RepID=V6LQ03_9EUKA|nr:hypothetical protein SS50377_26212 [Spironucleus salmonicida]|eukprot:EST42839.1 Hypothetical protein SS50377_17524 [Spironucleus salmonicida]
MAITPAHYLAPALTALLAVLWMLFVRRDNQEILVLQASYDLHDKIPAVRLLNEKRLKANKKPLDEAKFTELYEKELQKIRDGMLFARIARRFKRAN